MQNNNPNINSPNKAFANAKTKSDSNLIIKENITQKFIITSLALIILFLESIYILANGIKKGIFKKEVLTKKSNLGFDIIIRN
tara:strand:- start:268 stop:516 length:249 start_codon:yes stop_codon:yes gene_type:complete